MSLKINVKSVILYVLYAAAMVFMNGAVKYVPFSLGLCFAMLLCGTNIVLTPVLYALASVMHLNLISSLLSLFEGGFLCLVTLIYRKTGRKIKIEAAAYIIIALAPYIAFADWGNGISFIDNEYLLKGISAAAVTAFSYFCFKSVYAIIYRTMRCRLKEDETVCLAVVYAVFGAGVYNVAGGYVYGCLAAGLIIFAARLFKTPSALIFSFIAAIPSAVGELDFEPLTAYFIISLVSLLFCFAGRLAPSFAGGGATAVYFYFTGGFCCKVTFIVFRALVLYGAALVAALPSDKYLGGLKDRLLVKGYLQGTAVERCRKRTGEQLYRISEVFREIECAFCSLDEDIDERSVKAGMCADLKEKCCKICDKYQKCAYTNVYTGFKKLVDAGCMKGKVNLIDLPAEITANCSHPAEVLNKLNVLLSEYRRFMTEAENAKSGRALLADQAKGVAEVMKNCAADLSKSYGEYSQLEELLKVKLSTAGISCPELYIDGGDEVCAVILGKADIETITRILQDELKRKYVLKDNITYDSEKCCLVFGAPARLDAAFGVACAIKKGESVSGDTHSVIKINEHSFLMTLSDGMGSGEYARKVSSTAVSLIEAFYRAEMPQGIVLKTINKLLSFNKDERFTCIDIAAVNLNTGVTDFVKIGSPAGIIIREGEIKVLESESLPMGILDNLKPTVCTERLKAGDIVVFMSDGITSAFNSNTELYEYLQGLKPLNPQNLADKILAEAMKRAGEAVDDMTVLCTRIFEK